MSVAELGHAGDPEEIAWQAAYAASANAALPTQPACGRELGRWITPFRCACLSDSGASLLPCYYNMLATEVCTGAE